MASDTVGEFEKERQATLEGVLAGTTILHQWGVRVSPIETRVIHQVAVPSVKPDIDMGAHGDASREAARLLGDVNPLEVGYLGEMSRAKAASELAGKIATATT